jgi:hypothetical protein
MRGDIKIAICPAGTFEEGENVSALDLYKREGVQLLCTHNLETDFVLQAITKALSGEAAIPSSGAGSIVPVSMAVGSGMTPVTNSSTALDSELLRKAVTVTRTGNKVTYKITLTSGEALGQIGSLGLFGSDSGSGSLATGSITLGGTAVVGQLIKVTLDGRGIPAYYVGSTTMSAVATGLAAWLNGDGDFGSLYACTAAGSVVSVNSVGKGTVYNANVGVSVTGTITASITGMTGGTTPGGQLLAAANTYFRKERNTQLLIEWTISVSN